MDKKKEKVSVVIRVRPSLKSDDKTCVFCEDNAVEIFNHRNINENIKYEFSHVYDQWTQQDKLFYDCVQPKLVHALNGQNVSIFAYGPTGAGKTHTMLGSDSAPGIIPRAVSGIFQYIRDNTSADRQEWEYKVSFSYLEIYNEKVMDLLVPKETDLPIREDGNKNIFVQGLARRQITNIDDFKALFGPASKNRTVAATKLNERSSRSHSILLLHVKKTQLSAPYKIQHGKIYLIDLAGSEDNRRTGNQGIRLKESGAINKSLFTLGEVVDAINAGLPRVPYRNSKLTRLLQDSIGGSCHSVMITNIAPEERYYYDTYCTLNFASKSKKIVNNTFIRETTSSRMEVLTRKLTSPEKGSCCPDEAGPSTAKRPKLSAMVPDTPPKSQDPAPFLSPLLRRQERLEQTVNQRLKDLEQNIMQQINVNKVSTSDANSLCSKIHQQLEQIKALAKHPDTAPSQSCDNNSIQSKLGICEDHVVSPSSQPLSTNEDMVFPTERKCSPMTRKTTKVLFDRTNTMDDISTPAKQPHPKCMKRQKSESDMLTPSVLFVQQPRLFKKKGFKSTASTSSLSESDVSCQEKERQSDHSSPNGNSLEIDSEFLNRLNSSNVKELQDLQTVGVKRAKMIFEWREKFGPISNYEDLRKIPGFTEKYISNLLRSNFVLS